MKTPRKIVIVGGVAGGASAAARARRVDENAEIHIFERGPYISFANCGLPYFIAGEIDDRAEVDRDDPGKFLGALAGSRAREPRGAVHQSRGQNHPRESRRWRGARRGLRQTDFEPGREADCPADSRRRTAARVHAARHSGHGPHRGLCERTQAAPRGGHRRRFHRVGNGRGVSSSRHSRDHRRAQSAYPAVAGPRHGHASAKSNPRRRFRFQDRRGSHGVHQRRRGVRRRQQICRRT